MNLQPPAGETTTPDWRAVWENRLAAPMFAVSVLFLTILAGMFHRLTSEEVFAVEEELIHGGLAVLWFVVLSEAVFRFLIRDRSRSIWPALGVLLLLALVPPLRLGVPSQFHGRSLWLPFLGWQTINKHLRLRLERFFSVPMIVIAFMILPILSIEYFWGSHIREHPGLSLFLDIGTGLIWLAFCLEFIIMVSVAESKLRYCVWHWIEIAIILLPLIEYLPAARLLRTLRVLRIDYLLRMGRYYRLQALALRAWRAFLMLGLIERLIGRDLEKQLQRMEHLLVAKEEELNQLRAEIEQLKARIVQAKANKQSATVPVTVSTAETAAEVSAEGVQS